jgi:hypothetical protein
MDLTDKRENETVEVMITLDKVTGSLNPETKDIDKTVRELFPVLSE